MTNRRAVLLGVLACLALNLAPAAAQASTLSYDFSTGNDAWRFQNTSSVMSTPVWLPSAGNPGGAISGLNQSNEAGVLISPSAAAGDYSDHFGGTMQMDLKASAPFLDTVNLILEDGDSNIFGIEPQAQKLPSTTYDTFQYVLDSNHVIYLADPGDPDSQVPATNSQISELLANLTGFYFVTFDTDASGTGQLVAVDNVSLTGGASLPPPPPPPQTNVSRKLMLSYSKSKKHFTGKLKAPEDKATCASSQRVEVFQKRKGKDKKIGGPKTNSSGAFKLSYRKPGSYYASIDKKTDGFTTCKAAKSSSVKVR